MDGLGIAYNDLGVLVSPRGPPAAANTSRKRSECFQTVGNQRLVSNAKSSLGNVAYVPGQLPEAAAQFEAEIRMARETGDKIGVAQGLYDLGRLAWEQGDFLQASRRFEELVELARSIDSKIYEAFGLAYLANTLHRQGELERACALIREAIELSHTWSGGDYDHSFLIPTLAITGDLLVAREEFETAVKIFSLVSHSPLWNLQLLTPAERTNYERSLVESRAALGKNAFDAAWDAGQCMTIGEAVTAALGEECR